MAETNEDSTLNPELDPAPNPNPNKSERRQPKKSKTIAGHTPHFPGPLFPAVRRISTYKTNRITAPVGNTDRNDNNNRDSDSKKPLVEPRRQVSVASTSSMSPFGVGRSREFKLLLSLYLVSFLFRSICLAVVSVW
jgi:hypothetical protein